MLLQVRSLCLATLIAAITWVPSLLSSDQGTPVATPFPAVEVTIRSGSPTLPSGCDAAAVANLVSSFLDAFNGGDQDELRRFFTTTPEHPAPPSFQWFSVTGAGKHFVARDLQLLFPYFDERHEQHEVLRLVRLEVAADPRGEIAIAYDIVRRADDFPEQLVGGKGAIDCERRTIFVWSMGDAPALTDLASPLDTEVNLVDDPSLPVSPAS